MQPLGILWGEAAQAALTSGAALPLAGIAAYSAVGVIWRDGGGASQAVMPVPAFRAWAGNVLDAQLDAIGAPRAHWGGLPLDRPLIMGIVNATPDSFSDGGDNYRPDTAIATAIAMTEAGADIIDLGGESTRPGSRAVAIDEELGRVLPVVQALAPMGITVSIDTRHAQVMGAATAAGAVIINDVAALREPGALDTAAQSGKAVCVMHMLGEPGTMQDDPTYACAPLDIYDFLADRVAACEAAGIPRSQITVDPGIGFGKTFEHNTQTLAALSLYHGLGVGLLLGASRKRFVASLSRDELPKQRLPGSLAAALAGFELGVQIVRVHDVAETIQAAKVWRAIKAG